MTRWALLISAIAWACITACGDGSAAASDAAVAEPIDAAPTAGCQASGALSGVHEASLIVRGKPRTYLLSVPDDYDSSTAYPLVVGYHGRGSDSAQARSYFGVEEAAGGGVIAVYPQGLGLNGVPSDASWLTAEDSDDLVFFDAMLEAIGSAYCLDLARVFATGHSAGGFMTNHLACSRSSSLRAIAPVAGGGPLTPSCDGGSMAAMLIHGSLDVIVMPVLGERSRDYWLGADGCEQTRVAVEPTPCESYLGCGDGPLLWCLHSETELSGHRWPSFAPQGIWAFFAQF